MAKTEDLLRRIAELEKETGVKRTVFAACPNSMAVIKAAFRAAKRNDAPIYFAATLNQIDCDGGYTGMTQDEFIKTLKFEAEAVNFKGIYIAAIDHGGPWLKDKPVESRPGQRSGRLPRAGHCIAEPLQWIWLRQQYILSFSFSL